MATISRRSIPENHDLVLGVITKIQKHGIYIKLKEYNNVVGYCHISEIAGAWIRNIRNFVRIDQNVVAKVLRVDQETGQVDVSLKRVSDQQRKEKNLQYKRQNAAIAMIKLIAEKVARDIDEVREIIENPILDVYGSLYDLFEEVVAIGPEVLQEFDFPEDIAKAIDEVSQASIQITTVIVNATLNVRSFASDGVLQVKKFLKIAEKAAKLLPEVKSDITSIGTPAYRIHLEGYTVNEVLQVYRNVEEKLVEASENLNIEYKLEKDGNK